MAAVTGIGATTQAPPRVDFRRDIRPIFQQHCYECHGPDQQLLGFRLDRRADAMRGGTQAVIGPGNAEGSRLYHRLVDATAGLRMPPTGPLDSQQIALVKAWIDEGAEWPDDVSGEITAPPVDPDADRLAQLIRHGDANNVERLLTTTPRAATGRAAGGSTPLMFAALYGGSALVERLIKSGADPAAANVAGATALMWAVPNVDTMRVLLKRPIDVDARSEDGRTALVMAAGTVGSAPAVALLLEYGATPDPMVAGDVSAVREAARVGDVDAFKLLLDYGANPKNVPANFLRTVCFPCAQAAGVARDGPLPLSEPIDRGLRPTLPPESMARFVTAPVLTKDASRAAVRRSLPLLQRIGQPFIHKTGCVSCHHNSLVAMAVASARKNGYAVDETADQAQRRTTADYLESWRERTIQNHFIAGQQDSISYLLFGLAMAGHPPDQATEAQARWLLRRQAADGRWPLATLRPPIESNDIAVTALSLLDLRSYAPRPAAAEYAQAVARARQWLLTAKGDMTEQRAFRVLGLTWSGGLANTSAVQELVQLQRPDGGWAQLPSMESDAYATGEALVALHEARVGSDDRAVRRGVEFLLRTQLQDGSWFVKSRSVPIQAYFESGFPHGADQWISAAATAWAVAALAPMH
jgi:cytochrome c551/c552